jgi:hypothetical protein
MVQVLLSYLHHFFEAKSVFLKLINMKLDPKSQSHLWKHMFYKCAVRLGSKEEYKQRESTLSYLQKQIDTDSYSPDPHGFLSVPKGSLVTRFVPVFSYCDYSVYFACVGNFDEQLSKMAVDGTFGGWSLGGSIRKKEEEWAKDTFRRSTAKNSSDADVDLESISASVPASAYDPWAWVRHWNQYWLLEPIQIGR